MLGDTVLHGEVVMCCTGYKTTEKGMLSFASRGPKRRCCGRNGFVARLRLFEFQSERFLSDIKRNGTEEATDLQMNSCKTTEFRLWGIVNHTVYVINQFASFPNLRVSLSVECAPLLFSFMIGGPWSSHILFSGPTVTNNTTFKKEKKCIFND